MMSKSTSMFLILIVFTCLTHVHGKHESYHPRPISLEKRADQTPSAKCGNFECENGGMCAPYAKRVEENFCLCPLGYSGTRCENSQPGCDPNPCNIGKCVTTESGYTCKCPPGFMDAHCKVPIANPASQNATNEGVSHSVILAGACIGSLTVFCVGCWVFYNALVDKRKYLAKQKKLLGDAYKGPEPNCCSVCLNLMFRCCHRKDQDTASTATSKASFKSGRQLSEEAVERGPTPPLRQSSLSAGSRASSNPGGSRASISRNNHNRGCAYASMSSSACTSATTVTGSSISQTSDLNTRGKSYERYVFSGGRSEGRKESASNNRDVLYQSLAARRSAIMGGR